MLKEERKVTRKEIGGKAQEDLEAGSGGPEKFEYQGRHGR